VPEQLGDDQQHDEHQQGNEPDGERPRALDGLHVHRDTNGVLPLRRLHEEHNRDDEAYYSRDDSHDARRQPAGQRQLQIAPQRVADYADGIARR
jgi:hypothetical protein